MIDALLLLMTPVRHVEGHLSLLREQLRLTNATLNEINIVHAGCGEQEILIAELINQVEKIAHREVKTRNALTTA